MAPPPCASHRARHGLRDEEGAFQVDVDHGVPVGFGDVQEVGCLEDAGIVDQCVDTPECGQRRRQRGVDLRLERDVAVAIDRLVAACRERGCQRLAARIVDIPQRDRRAIAHQPLSACSADALRGTGHDGNLVLEIESGGTHRGSGVGVPDRLSRSMRGPAMRGSRSSLAGPIQPDCQALCVELDVHLQQFEHPFGAPAGSRARAGGRDSTLQALPEPGMALLRASAQCRARPPSRRSARTTTAQPRHVADAAEVRQVHALWRERREDARPRLFQRLGLELHRRHGRREPGWPATSNSRYDRPKVSPVKKPRLRSSQMAW